MENKPYSVESRVVMFMDIHNYSVVGRALQEAQYDFLQTVYERFGDSIVAHSGEIIKYLGDGILCVFATDAAVPAIQCALELRQIYANIVREWDLSQATELEIGLSAGPVAVGIFGHSSLRQRDVFSEIVNEAAVIGHHRGVAITAAVYERVKDNFPTHPLEPYQLKWREDPLHVWEIVE